MRSEQRRERISIFWEDDGFSTVGMALALLITLALIFTCAQVYEVSTASAKVQETADAAVLAGENMVGEYYLVMNVCDALLFTLSLAAVLASAVGVVCACIPQTATLSKAFFTAAKNFRSARDSFYKSASSALEQLAQALPFIATAKAQQVLSANSTNGHEYNGVVVLVPWEADGETVELSFSSSDEALDAAEEESDELAQAAEEAEEAAEAANEYKQHAYEHDSGSQTQYCMYERAYKLAGMTGTSNPYFSSVETWSFSVALSRAQTYYQKRLENEAPESSSVDDESNSALRKIFYAYAVEEVSQGYVTETDSSFDANFPVLAKNTSEMKETSLYTDAIYPITQQDGVLTMHAYSGCPGMSAGSFVGYGSIAEMDGNDAYEKCSYCKFAASSLGKVAAASSSISNGFEYHYNEVAKAAEEYEKAMEEFGPLSEEVQSIASGLFEGLSNALEEVFSNRISITPPGSTGALALVVDSGTTTSLFSSTFVGVDGASSLGTRVALSAATLVAEESDEGETILTSFLDGVEADSLGLGATQQVLTLWSGLLGVYGSGADALSSALETVLNAISLTSYSNLGTWAADVLEECMENSGWEAPDLRAQKAALVNSSYVLEADNSSFSAQLLSVKNAAIQAGAVSSLSGALSYVESSLSDALFGSSGTYTIATIELLEGAVSIPITISLPQEVSQSIATSIQNGIESFSAVIPSISELSPWE